MRGWSPTPRCAICRVRVVECCPWGGSSRAAKMAAGVLTIATWNVERVGRRSWKRLPAIRQVMAAVDADVWVLTETRDWLSPADGITIV